MVFGWWEYQGPVRSVLQPADDAAQDGVCVLAFNVVCSRPLLEIETLDFPTERF